MHAAVHHWQRALRRPPPPPPPPLAHTTCRATHVAAHCLLPSFDSSAAAVLPVQQVAQPGSDSQPPKLSAQQIAARIEASRSRRAKRTFLRCPACGIGVASAAALHTHMRSCCLDLVQPAETSWQQALSGIPGGPRAAVPPGYPPVQHLLDAAATGEATARDAVLHWTFRSGHNDAAGKPIRYSPTEVAARLGLPVARYGAVLRVPQCVATIM